MVILASIITTGCETTNAKILKFSVISKLKTNMQHRNWLTQNSYSKRYLKK